MYRKNAALVAMLATAAIATAGMAAATSQTEPVDGSNPVMATPIEIPLIDPVGATPIEIPGTDPVGATPIEIPGTGTVGATPIEIPGGGMRLIPICDPNDPNCEQEE